MFLTGVTTELINQYEPSLSSYYPSGSSDWINQIGMGKRYLVSVLRDKKKDTRKYLVPFAIYTDTGTGVNGTFTSDATEAEPYDRNLWIVDLISTGAPQTLYLQGTNVANPSESDWAYIPANESRTGLNTTLAISSGAISDGARVVKPLSTTFKYYRIKTTFTFTTRFNSYLIEASFHFAHLYKTLEIIFNMLIASDEVSRWSEKRDMYANMYNMEVGNMIAYYDEDGNGEIDGNETNSIVTETRLYR